MNPPAPGNNDVNDKRVSASLEKRIPLFLLLGFHAFMKRCIMKTNRAKKVTEMLDLLRKDDLVFFLFFF